MLKFLNITARYLHRFKIGIGILLFASSIGFFIIILTTEANADVYAMLCAVLCLWSLGLLMITSYFPIELAKITESDRFFTQLKKRLRYGFVWFVGLIATLTSLGIVIITIRMLSVITK